MDCSFCTTVCKMHKPLSWHTVHERLKVFLLVINTAIVKSMSCFFCEKFVSRDFNDDHLTQQKTSGQLDLTYV